MLNLEFKTPFGILNAYLNDLYKVRIDSFDGCKLVNSKEITVSGRKLFVDIELIKTDKWQWGFLRDNTNEPGYYGSEPSPDEREIYIEPIIKAFNEYMTKHKSNIKDQIYSKMRLDLIEKLAEKKSKLVVKKLLLEEKLKMKIEKLSDKINDINQELLKYESL